MATAGMGDLLSGVCAALLANGLSPHDAAKVGAWICGRAAEFAVLGGDSQESLSASHLMGHFGAAFESLRSGWA
jgi:NAD(P)H-hydrate epimerase